ncbi:MAG: acylneuraminate cytidylyltransferase family protein [Methanospirillaceae archaeon]|nr:acylneuraminate cytidylyltransferase family protein [Methanospirillaceae archaeon]
MDIVALIPARSGSKRIHDKNISPLLDHPLIAYTIQAALDSGIFASVIVSTNSLGYADIARYYGADVPFLRPDEYSQDLSPDIDWVRYTLIKLTEIGMSFDCFSILRPTSPFRMPHTIQRAWKEFTSEVYLDSLRAIEKCTQHPGKMWIVRGKKMYPLLPFGSEKQPWHSSPTQSLPDIYIQNASLEIAWTKVAIEKGTISGEMIVPFFTEGLEGFDINYPYDWQVAEELIRTKQAILPSITQIPYNQQ